MLEVRLNSPFNRIVVIGYAKESNVSDQKKHADNNQHYDEISEAWRIIFGDNFHWGLYLKNTDSLEDATVNLIEKMANFADIRSEDAVLDIGCGIGESARYLAKNYRCSVLGISNSEVGIGIAGDEKVAGIEFKVADALNNGTPADSYDVGWLLEMSHLIENKTSLVKEAYRSLKPGGRIVLCDLTLKKQLSAKEVVAIMDELKLLEFSFGKASLITLERYRKIFEDCGLLNIKMEDISEQVIPTITGWRSNCFENRNAIIDVSSEGHFENFVNSCDILKEFYESGRWGYGVIVGHKPE